MISLGVIALSIFITVDDLQNHRIRHISLLLLAIPLSIGPYAAPIQSILLASLLLSLVTLMTRLGGGDLKLFLLLFIFQGAVVISLEYLQWFLLASSVEACIFAILRRSIAGSIPLAPAILAPFLLCYLAI